MPGERVLMIAHHFPPTGGSGSNRALAFARYLPECGWEPTVVTPGAGWAANRDDRLLQELPPGLRVLRTRSFEPRPAQPLRPGERARSAGEPPSPLRRQLRSNLGHLKRFPDAHLGWLPFALAAASRVTYDVAYSSSGPFTSHLIGLLLKRLTRRPWVAELRDGWFRWNRAIFPDYPAWRNLLERRLEAAALRSADRVILVTDRMADAFRCQYADALPREHFSVVPNGFDPLQLPESPAGRPSSPRFEVLHAGALYYGRSLTALLDAARGLVAALPSFAQTFRLTLLGTLDPAARAELCRSGLEDRIDYRGQLDHASTIRAMREADVLLLVANTTPGAEATVPGKLFEYLAVGRPVLAIAPPESSTADVLNRTRGGWLVPSGEPDAIAHGLQTAFQGHQSGAPQVPEPGEVARFDRRLLTRDLAAIFDQASAGAARGI